MNRFIEYLNGKWKARKKKKHQIGLQRKMDPVVASIERSTTLIRISLLFIVATFFATVLGILLEWRGYI